MCAVFSSLLGSPSQQPKPSCRASWELCLRPLPLHPFQWKLAFWESPPPPCFPRDLFPEDRVNYSMSVEVKAGRRLGALSDVSFTNALKMSEPTGYSCETSLLTILKSLAVVWGSASLQAHPSFFSLTSGRALCLPWAGLFSVWVSFKRGERFVAS